MKFRGWKKSMMTFHLDILWTNLRQIKRLLFQEFAKVSLNRLEKYFQKILNDLISIYELQPQKLYQQFRHHFRDPNNWCIGIRERNNENHPKIIHRNEYKKVNKISVEIIKHYIMNDIKVVINANSSSIRLIKEELLRSITEIIDRNIYGKTTSSQWSGFGRSHDYFEITFQIPSADFIIDVSVKVVIVYRLFCK